MVGLADGKHLPLRGGCIHTVCTSPPFWGLRKYPNPASIGHEPTFGEHLGNIRQVFREVWRVLRDDGTLWLEYGDAWSGGKGNSEGWGDHADTSKTAESRKGFGMRLVAKEGSLMLMPARVAMALEADGWYLRAENIWARPNPMPESCRNRTTRAHSYVYMLTKRKTGYFYDQDAERREGGDPVVPIWNGSDKLIRGQGKPDGSKSHPSGSNLRSVWQIPTEPLGLAHYAAYPSELVRRCVSLGTSVKGCCPACGAQWARMAERVGGKATPTMYQLVASGGALHGGTENCTLGGNQAHSVTIGWSPSCTCNLDPVPCLVLDPFVGSGTTLSTANAMGRRAIGFDIAQEYAIMAKSRQHKHRVVRVAGGQLALGDV